MTPANQNTEFDDARWSRERKARLSRLNPERSITLPPVTPDEYEYIMRLLGADSDIGIRDLGKGLTGAGVIRLRDKFTIRART
jgi:hypothetical protein